MQISTIQMFSPNIICNCVDKYETTGISGKLYHSYSKEPYRYKDINEMLLKMDEFYEQIRFPMASTESRSFSKCKANKIGKEMMVMKEDDNLLDKRGDKSTFVIQVQYRQNATWQGKIVWIEEDRTQYFRSALELIKIMDSALCEEDIKQGIKLEDFSYKEEKKCARS